MSYIGNTPFYANLRTLDDISGSFDGSTTVFNLTFEGDPVHVGYPAALLVVVGGVPQEPGSAYTLAGGGDQIEFSSAPASGEICHIRVLGAEADIGVPGDGMVGLQQVNANVYWKNGGEILHKDDLAANGGSIPETDHNNTFTRNQRIEKSAPVLEIYDTNTVDRNFDLLSNAGKVSCRLRTDDNNQVQDIWEADHDNNRFDIGYPIYENGTRVVESGSNSDGSWVRYSDGTQIVRNNSVSGSFNNRERLQGTFTFPAAFNNTAYTFLTTLSSITTTPSIDQLSILITFANNTTDGNIAMYRINGATDFQSGDEAKFATVAIGTWT